MRTVKWSIGPFFSKILLGTALRSTGSCYRGITTDFLWPANEDLDLDELRLRPDEATCHSANLAIDLVNRFDNRLSSHLDDVIGHLRPAIINENVCSAMIFVHFTAFLKRNHQMTHLPFYI